MNITKTCLLLGKIKDTLKLNMYGIPEPEEKQLVIDEAKQILDVRDVIASIILVDDLRIQKD